MTDPVTLDPLLVWIAAACIATLFAHAAVAKWADLALLEQHLAAYGVPAALLPVAVRALPAAETALALALLSPWRTQAAPAAALLLAVYAAAMAWHRAQHHVLDCGCGGEPLPVSWVLVARNVVLSALALAAGATMGPRAMGVGDFLVVAAALLVGTLLFAALHQVLRHRAGPPSRKLFGRA